MTCRRCGNPLRDRDRRDKRRNGFVGICRRCESEESIERHRRRKEGAA